MQRKTLSLFVLSTFGLLLIGCNRGCTTQRTIASESTTIATPGGDVEITGRVIDYRHSRRQGADAFDRKVSHTYGLSFDLKYGTFVRKKFYSEGVKDPKSVKLPKELTRVRVAVSNDKNHIGLGVDGKVVSLIHLYNSNPIQTNKPSLVADGTMKWGSLDINSYPSPESILTESLKASCGEMITERQAMFDFCDSKKPTDKIHRVMLDQWPDCNLAKDYLSEKRVKVFSRSPSWRKYAEKRGRVLLNDISSHSSEFEEIMFFVGTLNSKELNTTIDSLLVNNWGKSSMIDYTEALRNRIAQKKNPLSREARQEVYEQAKAGFTEFERSGRSNHRREAIECLQILSDLGDTTTGYNFVENSFGANIKHFKPYDFYDVAYDDFGVYTDYQQQLIIQKTEGAFAYVKDYSRSGFYYAIRDLVDCSMLKRLMKKYPDDLKNDRIPARCGP